jgi:large subunit ribosomal protein L10
VKRAANEKGIELLDSFLEGPNALAFSKDPVAVAKILTEFAKTNKAFEIKAGLLEGKLISFDNIKDLADLPSREVLLARVLSGMMAPLNGMVNVLQGPMRNFAQVLEAYRKQQAGEA